VLDNFWAFLFFVIAMTGTPGAGNLSMLALGQTVGYRRALPFLAGIVTGGVCIDLLVAFGLGELYVTSPDVALVFKIASTAYILHLAWKILRMHVAPPEKARPFSYAEGLILHPLNPKTWAMAVSSFSQFADPLAPQAPQIAVFVLTFFGGMITFHSLWCLVGASLLHMLETPRARLAVNGGMVVMMVGATMYALFT
jgi:threonine/homoserine/homoserine lactone efflux protein